MVRLDKVIRYISIPYSALISVIFGIMIISFPIGAYLVFDSDLGNSINFQYPLNGFNFFIGGISYKLPISFEIGDAFFLAWSTYIILFAITYTGPRGSLTRTLTHVMSEGWHDLQENGLVNAISWFSIIVLLSVAIDSLQGIFGIKIQSPGFQNGLIQFFQLTVSPITEEVGFRVLLIGIPLFLMFSNRASFGSFLSTLWKPAACLSLTDNRKVFAIIITVGVFFGVAHVLSGNPWSAGKVTQATMAGIILGWVYVRYGLGPAILVHWSTNYFIYSYQFFISTLSQSPLSSDFANPFSDTLEQLLIVTGLLAIGLGSALYLKKRREKIKPYSGT